MEKEKENEKRKGIRKFIKVTRRRVVVLVILVGAFLAWRFLINKQNGDLKEATVERGVVQEDLVLTGEIKATEHANLGFETSGKLVYIGVTEGQEVKKGTLLGKLDTTTLNSAYQQAQANLRKYEATVENVHDQVKDHDSDETYAQKDTRTTAEATKDYYYEAVIAAERNLKGASLYAPFAGIVTKVTNPYVGAFTIYTEKQFELLNPETIFFSVTADQTEVVNLHVSQKVKIVLDSLSDKEFTGVIDQIGLTPMAGEVGTVYEVKVKFDDINLGGFTYGIGMTGDASFTLSEAQDVLYVPTGFVKSENSDKYVLVDEGKKKVYVEIGIEGEERVEVKGDLTEGQTVYD